MNVSRKKTKQIRIGNLMVGSNNPVYIQSMPKKSIRELGLVIDTVKKMQHQGCDLIRVAVRNVDEVKKISRLKKYIKIPLIADIHFNYKLALMSIQEGCDGIRLNPHNIYKEEDIFKIVEKAKKFNNFIRIGVNSGSLDKTRHVINQSWAKKLNKLIDKEPVIKEKNFYSPEVMTAIVLDYIRLLESMDFYNIMFSIKSEDVKETVYANRVVSGMCDYPVHLGVTATGISQEAVIKSSIGIGSLLLDGIGDIIRVSLTSDPFKEIEVARNILASLNIRNFGPRIISCPTCGRSLIDVEKIVVHLKKSLHNKDITPLNIAVMGCEVNGPGEAKHADIGIAGGSKSVLLFKKGKKIKKVNSDKAVEELVRYMKEWDK